MEFKFVLKMGGFRDFELCLFGGYWNKKERSGDVEDVIVGWLVSWNMQF